MRRHLPPKSNFIGKILPEYPNHAIQDYVASGANGHVFRAHDTATGGSFAFKIVPVRNLPDAGRTDEYLKEAQQANLIHHPAVVKYHDVLSYRDLASSTDCIVFVCDYVEGKSLKEYITRPEFRPNIDISFIVSFLETTLSLLFELQERGLEHGDLHAGNVLVARTPYAIDNQTSFRITDFRVGKLISASPHRTDYLYTAETLNKLLYHIDYSSLSGQDRYIFDRLRREFLQRHLIETDSTADPLSQDARALYLKLRGLRDDYQAEVLTARTSPALQTPFDYPNCEQIGNSHLLLKALYSDRLLGIQHIDARSNVVLTGPRGCGKTTVFRAACLDYLTSTKADDPGPLRFLGVYYRCDDLYFAFPRYRAIQREEAVNIPMHFLVVTLLGSGLQQLDQWARSHFPEWAEKLPSIVEELWTLLSLEPPEGPNSTALDALVGRLLGKERERAARKQRFAHLPKERFGRYLGPEKLLAACGLLRTRLSFLRDRPFQFFIDDYSSPKISVALQENLNRLVMHRNADVFFKVSTESPVSFVARDIDGKNFVEGREYDFVNLGLRYITDASDRPLAFIEDLFRRRFKKVANYPVSTLLELLGSRPRNENATARVLRGEGSAEEVERYGRYAGRETVAAMCSGDIHYVIRLVARMVDDFGGVDELRKSYTSPRIPETSQNASIRAAAGSFLESIRTVPGRGPQLAQIISAFGKVAHSYLLHRTSSNRDGLPAYQASRIEPYEALRLSHEADELLSELLRYSVLIEDPRGKSRRGDVVPRFYLRRYLVPHFRLTFSRRDSIELEEEELEALFCEPAEFERKFRLRNDVGGDPNQMGLL